MDKFSFISKEGKKDLVDLDISDGVLTLKLNLETDIKHSDGYDVCSCNKKKRSPEDETGYECGQCNASSKWNLEDEYNKQQKTIKNFGLLKRLLSSSYEEEDLVIDYTQINNLFDDLLTEKQKRQLNIWLIRKTLFLNLKLNHVTNNLSKLEKEFEDFKNDFTTLKIETTALKNDTSLKINNLEKNKTDPLEVHFNKFDEKVNQSIEETKEKISKDTETIIKEKFEELVNLSNCDEYGNSIESENIFNKAVDENYDIQKIKRTLNIIMELFKEGMDFEGILLKAKVDLKNNNFNSVINTNANYNLSNDNEGNYFSDNIEGAKDAIFQRFNDV